MSAKKDAALEKVQNLYLMQVVLWDFLDQEEVNPQTVDIVRKTLRDFKALLQEVDWQFMGDEEVLKTLQSIPMEVDAKLRSTKKTVKTKKKK